MFEIFYDILATFNSGRKFSEIRKEYLARRKESKEKALSQRQKAAIDLSLKRRSGEGIIENMKRKLRFNKEPQEYKKNYAEKLIQAMEDERYRLRQEREGEYQEASKRFDNPNSILSDDYIQGLSISIENNIHINGQKVPTPDKTNGNGHEHNESPSMKKGRGRGR